jgi:KS-AT-KR-ACP domain-containing polyene macrolide polyketide synthase/pimaricinolide synthase PimS2/candicidin polyketide synthase FscD
MAAAGLSAVRHPLLAAAVELAEAGGFLLTGRLSVAAQAWLADHAVHGVVLVPGAALLEMAVRAGDEAGCGQVAELTMAAPLVLQAEGRIAVQVTVGAPDEAVPPGQHPVASRRRPRHPLDGSGEFTRVVDLDSASDEEVFNLLDNELGLS